MLVQMQQGPKGLAWVEVEMRVLRSLTRLVSVVGRKLGKLGEARD
jgi:hypothetical protein